MRRFLILFLCLPSFAMTPARRTYVEHKAVHALVGIGVAEFGRRQGYPKTGVAVAFGLGIAKELYDRKHGDGSCSDVAWTGRPNPVHQREVVTWNSPRHPRSPPPAPGPGLQRPGPTLEVSLVAYGFGVLVMAFILSQDHQGPAGRNLVGALAIFARIMRPLQEGINAAPTSSREHRTRKEAMNDISKGLLAGPDLRHKRGHRWMLWGRDPEGGDLRPGGEPAGRQRGAGRKPQPTRGPRWSPRARRWSGVQVTVQPSAGPVEPLRPPRPMLQYDLTGAAMPVSRVDLTLVRMPDQTRRVLASSPDGRWWRDRHPVETAAPVRTPEVGRQGGSCNPRTGPSEPGQNATWPSAWAPI